MASICDRTRLRLPRIWFLTLFIGFAFAIGSLASAKVALDGQLVGVWRGQEQSLLGKMQVEAIFFRNHTYSRMHILGSLVTRDTGTYEIAGNWIHFRLRSWEPTEYMGKPLAWPETDTWKVTRLDNRVLETETVYLERAR